MTQTPGDHKTLLIVCHVGLHIDFSFVKFSLDLKAFTIWWKVNLEGNRLFN